MSHPWHAMPASLLAGRRGRMTLHRTRHASHDPAVACCHILLRTLLVDSLHPAHLAMTPTKTHVAPSSTRWRHSHRTCTPWPRGYGLAESEMPDARLEARLGAKPCHTRDLHALAGQGGREVARPSRRRGPPWGGWHPSWRLPPGPKLVGQGLSQTERAISLRNALQDRGRDGAHPPLRVVWQKSVVHY